MKINEDEIVFKIHDKKTIKELELACSIIGIDPDLLFEDYVKQICYKALKKVGKRNLNFAFEGQEYNLNFNEQIDALKRKVERWFDKPELRITKVIKAFIATSNLKDNYDERQSIRTSKSKMFEYIKYAYNTPDDQMPLYEQTFRSLCSNARNAYGKLFKLISISDDEIIVELNQEFVTYFDANSYKLD